MSNLISRQDVLEALRTCYETERIDYTNGDEYINYEQAVHEVEQLPSAQPEIIRCRDCKYYRKYGYINGKPEFLPKCTFCSIYVNADDFCSKAERRKKHERFNQQKISIKSIKTNHAEV